MKIIKQLAAAFLAVITLASLTITASAEEKSIILPSGISLERARRELSDKAAELGGGEPQFASAAVGIFKDGEILLEEYYGKTDMENNIPADESSVYEWGSISKTLIWVSAMQLWERGELDLERDVREYLPDGFFRNLTYNEPITMLNLMNHTAGWQETTRPIWETDETALLPLGDALQACEPAQVFRPGEVAAYSNYGAAVAAYVIECITKTDYCEYVRKNIFEPLGMERTALLSAHGDNEWVYARRKEMNIYSFGIGGAVDLGNYLNYVTIYPAGAATGTLADLMTFAQSLVDDAAPLFKDPDTRVQMFTATDFYGSSDIPKCAHGFWCMEYAVRTFGHSGATMAGQADMLLDLDSKTGLVIMVNEPNGNAFLSETPELVFGKLSAERFGAADNKNDKADLRGYYTLSRSTYRGMLKLMPFVSAISSSVVRGAQSIGDGVYVLDSSYGTILLGEKTLPSGKTVLQQPSADLLHDGFCIAKLILLALYILLAISAIYLLRISRKLKKHGKQVAIKGVALMTAGQIARLVSVTALFVMIAIYASCGGGLPTAAGAVIGVVQMLCAAACGASAATSLMSVISLKKQKARYILNTLACAVFVFAIMYFEMYRFWGI